MKLKEIVERVKFNEVFNVIEEEYPDQKDLRDNYFEEVYRELKRTKPGDSEKFYIYISKEKENLLSDDSVYSEYYSVSAYTEGDPQSYSISFEPWEKWLDMEVEISPELDLKNKEIVAHCLWEMTFFGFDQGQIQETKESLIEMADNIKSEKEELISLDDVSLFGEGEKSS